MPDDWTAKLNSDEFLKQWYSTKPEQNSQQAMTDPFPSDHEEQKAAVAGKQAPPNKMTLAVKSSLK